MTTTSPPLVRPGRPAGVRPHSTGLVGALNAEWRDLGVAPSAHARLRAWAEGESAFAGFRSLDDVVRAIGTDGDDAVLHALLRRARSGDLLATRAVLQAMLGSLLRLAWRTRVHAGDDMEESVARAVAAAWQVIVTYPRDRACRPSDGISLDVLKILTGGDRGLPEVPAGLPADVGDPPVDAAEASERRSSFWAQIRSGRPPSCADEELVELLAWSVREGVISRADAQLLVRLHSPDVPGVVPTCREVAEHLGVAHAAVRQRASRAVRRMQAAVGAVLAPAACADRAAA